MTLYDRIFINHYNFYRRNFSPDRIASAYFLTALKSVQIGTLVNPFYGYLMQYTGHQQRSYFLIAMALSMFIFDQLYYNQKRLDDLSAAYSELTDKNRKQSRITSILISAISVIAFFFTLVYFHAPVKL